MKKYLRLTLFLLRSGGARRNKDKKRGRVGMVFTGLFILLAFLMVMGVNGFAGWQAARMGQPFGSFYPASYGSYSIFVLILAVPTLIALYFTMLQPPNAVVLHYCNICVSGICSEPPCVSEQIRDLSNRIGVADGTNRHNPVPLRQAKTYNV